MVVFVPLSGLTSVNYDDEVNDMSIWSSFRPLIGVNFCKQYIKKMNITKYNK